VGQDEIDIGGHRPAFGNQQDLKKRQSRNLQLLLNFIQQVRKVLFQCRQFGFAGSIV
jgi:hypothetical protein